MKIVPLGDRVAIKPAEQETKTKSGIIIPDTADKEKPEQGKVIAVGKGDKIKKLDLKKGDVILFSKYAGEDKKIEGKEYKFVGVGDVIAKFVL